MRVPNITNSIDVLYVHCDLVSGSIVNGTYGIEIISMVNLARIYSFITELGVIGFCKLNKLTIQSIKIYITDP